jgi:hypothetical protein
MVMSKDIPLYKRAHFRRIKEVLTELADYEGYNINNYNLDKITAYDTMGVDLRGRNVRYNIQGGYSCWVGDNKYEMYEVPSKRNKIGSPYGDFLYLAFNKSFDYYLFGKLEISLDSSASRTSKQLKETVYYKNHGKYSIIFQQGENHIHKVEKGSEFDPGLASSDTTADFDSYNSRKKAYRTSKHQILADLGVNNLNSNKISGKDPVKIYNKPKPKSSKPEIKKPGIKRNYQ